MQREQLVQHLQLSSSTLDEGELSLFPLLGVHVVRITSRNVREPLKCEDYQLFLTFSFLTFGKFHPESQEE